MPLDAQVYERGIDLLRGSYIDLGVYVFSLALSSGVLIGGVSKMIDSDTDRILALQPVVFLVAQSFTVTTTWRDRTMFVEFDIARPTQVNVYQSLFFFLFAFLFLAHVLGNIVTWPAFYSLGSLWVIVSALLVSKWIRDRNYAEIFQSVHDDDLKEIFEKVMSICQGSMELQVFIWGSFAVAFLTTHITNWGWKDHVMSFSYKGTVTLLSLWSLTATIHMVKVLRDRRDPVKNEDLKEQYAFQFMVAASWALSSCLIFVLLTLEIQDWQRFFLSVGWGYILLSTFAVAKTGRDRREAFHILAAAESPHDESVGALGSIYMDQLAKGQQNGLSNGHSPKAISKNIQPVGGLTAPLERRGEAAKLIGQRSLVLEEGIALKDDYTEPQQPKAPRGIATE